MKWEALEEKLQSLLEEAMEKKQLLDKMLKAPLPDQIDAIADLSDSMVEALIPMTGKATYAKWRKRAAKIEAINSVLVDFEIKAKNTMVAGEYFVIAKNLERAIFKWKWLIGNIGIITLSAHQIFSSAINVQSSALALLWFEIMAALYPGEGYIQREELEAQEINEQMRFAKSSIEAISVYATISVITQIVQELLVGFTYAGMKRSLRPLIKIKKEAIYDMEQKAFPQGSGRVRRKKVHRIRNK